MANYTVKAGDSWYKIAKEQLGYGGKYADLAKFNNMSVNSVIHPGQTIRIPDSTKTAASPAQTAANNTNLAVQNQQNSRPQYQQSAAVTKAQNAVNAQVKPGEYQSQYQPQIDKKLDDLLNSKQQAYDPYSDPLFQMYRDQHMQGGKTAMRDTMANAAALSGGYGNSYAATAGNQAYQQYLMGLNDKIPDLAALADQRYQNEMAAKRNNLSLLQGMEDDAYGRHRDALSDYYTERDYLTGRADAEYNRDYGAYRDSVSDWENERAFEYQKAQDEQAQKNWEREFALSQYKASSGARTSVPVGKDGNVWGNMTDKQIDRAMAYEDDIAGAVKYLESVGTSGVDEMIGRLREIGFTDGEIEEYVNGGIKDPYKGQGASAKGNRVSFN